MYQDILKIPMDTLDDPKINKDNMRIYRDKATDQFASTIFKNKEKLCRFLDYTFHAINSYLVIHLNEELIDISKQNPGQHILPLCGDESVIFVFKGGTVMHILYNTYMDSIKNKIPLLKSNDMIKYYADIKNVKILEYMGISYDNFIYNGAVNDQYKRNLMRFNYDIENDKYIENRSDILVDFIDGVLKPKFSISDIDYGLYINADTNSRYLLIHGVVVKLLYMILNNITEQFDNHLNDVLSGKNTISKPDEYLETIEIDDIYNHPYMHVVRALKRIICNPSLHEDISDNNGYYDPSYFTAHIQYQDNLDDISLKKRIIILLKEFNDTKKYEHSLYKLYCSLEIITYTEYIDKINIKFFDHQIDLVECRSRIIKNISILVESKKYDLIKIPYYDMDTINTIK